MKRSAEKDGPPIVSFSYSELRAADPCSGRTAAAIRRLGTTQAWSTIRERRWTFAEVGAGGLALEDLVWIALTLARDDDDVERRLRLWLTDCAAHVLHHFEDARPADDRPRQAIEQARASAPGEIDVAASRAWSATADAVVVDAACAAAANAAAAAASWDTTADASDAAGAAAVAAAWGTADALTAADAWCAAKAAEERWQRERLVARMCDSEPGHWSPPNSAQPEG